MRIIRRNVRNGHTSVWVAMLNATSEQVALRERLTRVFNTNIDALMLKEYFHKQGERHGKLIDSERNSLEQFHRLSVKQLKRGI